MVRSVWLSMGLVALVGCGGPDAMAMLGADDGVDDVETLEGELTSTSRAATWLPMQEGNRWTFTSASGSREVTLTDVGSGMALLSGLHAQPVWVGHASANTTTLLMWNGADWVPFVRFGYARTTWTVGEGACNTFKVRRVATGSRLATAAGDFTDTRTIAFEQQVDPSVRCAAPEFTELTFVPRVGLVSFVTGRGERFSLARAQVNGAAMPVEATTTVLSLDAASYTSKPNTIACIAAPCFSNAETAVAKVRFQVKNVSATSQSFHFTSGCQFDVEAVTATGHTVARLAERQVCHFALTDLVLAPGEAKTFDADFTLEDSQGLQLDGDFTLRATLNASAGAMRTPPTASVPLAVRVSR